MYNFHGLGEILNFRPAFRILTYLLDDSKNLYTIPGLIPMLVDGIQE